MPIIGRMRWDVFCRVIDNHGDLGVCWRLCADLAARGQTVRLWVDDPAALAWMAPGGAAGVTVVRWAEPLPALVPGDVVIEAFGCDPPAAFVERMASARKPPAWINLEYLSAEPYVERSHGLPSPTRIGLTKWFYFPGFTPSSGGLLREPQALTTTPLPTDARAGERVVSLFAYAHAPFEALFDRLAEAPTLLLLAAGASQAPALAALAAKPRPNLRARALPWLTQTDYDRLLAACALNIARGEDSIVRAMWAGAPFVWHIYPQHDGAHAPKLDALLDRMNADACVRELWRAWNGLGPWPARLPDPAPWRLAACRWRDELAAQPDLTSRLLRLPAIESRASPPDHPTDSPP
jgi:uncharacterized repeat protein (TIGR03837 family)